MTIHKLNQRDTKWRNDILGHGTVTIGGYGCTLTALTMLARESDVKASNNRGKANGLFGGATKNLILWQNITRTFPSLEFITRAYTYNNTAVSNAIKENGGCLVEVNGQRIGGTKHWILFIGGGKAIDPWTGTEISTGLYTPATGYAIIKYKKPASTNTGDTQKEPIMSQLIQYLGVSNEEEAKAKLKEHLGETSGKCAWGSGKDKGFLGSERERRAFFENLSVQLANEQDEFKAEISQLKRDLTACENEFKRITDELTKKNADIVKQNDKYTKLAEELKECQKLANTSNNVSDEIVRELRDLRDNIKQIEKLNSELTIENEKLKAEMVKLKDKAKDNICTIKKALINLIDEIIAKINSKNEREK